MKENRADSVRVAYPLFQGEGGGATPTSALQLRVEPCSYEFAAELNAKWHSVLPRCDKGSMWRGFKAAFAAQFNEVAFAVAIWSSPMTQSIDDGVTSELRRFAISADAPPNTGSRILAVMARLMKKLYPSLSRLVSYQAIAVHTGTIYKAAGWTAAKRTKFSKWGTRKRRKPRSAKQCQEAVNGYVETSSTRKPPQIESDKIRWEKKLSADAAADVWGDEL